MPYQNSRLNDTKFALSPSFVRSLVNLVRYSPALNNHNFLELLALKANLKNVVRIVVGSDKYPEIEEFCHTAGFLYGCSRRKQKTVQTHLGDIFTVSVDWNDPEGNFVVVIISSVEKDLESALHLEDGDGSFREFGRLYQYPQCCVEGYGHIKNGEDWIARYLEKGPLQAAGYYQCNRLAVLFDESILIPDYFPCGMTCEKTRKIGLQYEELLHSINKDEWLSLIRRSLKSPILVRNGVLLQIVDSRTVEENTVEYEPRFDWQINWRGELPTDDVFYRANSLQVAGDELLFFSDDKLLDSSPVGISNNRLLFFH